MKYELIEKIARILQEVSDDTLVFEDCLDQAEVIVAMVLESGEDDD